MPRLRQVPRADAGPLATITYDRLFGPDRDPVASPGTGTGAVGDRWTASALVPDVLEHSVRGFQRYRSPERRLDPQRRELRTTGAGWAVGSPSVPSQHCKSCRGVGIPDEKVAAVPSWGVASCSSDLERAVLDRGRVAGRGRRRPEVPLSDEEVLELTCSTSLYLMHAVMSRALRVELDDVDDPVVEVPAPEGHDPMPMFEE